MQRLREPVKDEVDKESTLKSQLSKKEKLIEELQKEIEELRKENEVNQIKNSLGIAAYLITLII